MYGIVFWEYLLTGGELGNATHIDVLLVSSALSPPNITLIENDDIVKNLVSKSWCFLLLSLRGYLVEIESNLKHDIIFYMQ